MQGAPSARSAENPGQVGFKQYAVALLRFAQSQFGVPALRDVLV